MGKNDCVVVCVAEAVPFAVELPVGEAAKQKENGGPHFAIEYLLPCLYRVAPWPYSLVFPDEVAVALVLPLADPDADADADVEDAAADVCWATTLIWLGINATASSNATTADQSSRERGGEADDEEGVERRMVNDEHEGRRIDASEDERRLQRDRFTIWTMVWRPDRDSLPPSRRYV